MTDKQLVALYDQTLYDFLNIVERKFMESNLLADEWHEFEDRFRERAAQRWQALQAQLTPFERHATLRKHITDALSQLLDDDPLYQKAMAMSARKARIKDAIARLDYDVWFLRNKRLHLQLQVYAMEAECDDFLTETDRQLHERFRNRQRARRNPIYWRGGGIAIMEPTDDPVALGYLRDSETVIMTRHAGALYATFEKISHSAYGVLNHLNRPTFFQSMGRPVKAVLDANPEATEYELIRAALGGARSLLEEWAQTRLHTETLNVVDEGKLREVMRVNDAP